MRIKSVHTRCLFGRCLFGLLAIGTIAAAPGCGYVPPEVEKSPSPRTDGSVQTCDQAPLPEDALTLIVLDWDGGQSPLVRDKLLTGFNVTSLDIADEKGISQAEFESVVLDRVREILCVLDPMDVAVIIGDGGDYHDSTVIHITGDEPANNAKHIGQSHFDLCNEHLDDSGVIWGGALANRVESASVDEWVNAFANTIAHETGHTLGFFHPDPGVVDRLLQSPSTEIMRANTTTEELLKPQAFLLDQDTCPGEVGVGDTSYRVTGGVAYELE